MINRIGLTNFKAFDDLELPMGSLTLLSGLNASGKSSVLQALAVLRQSFESGSLGAGELDLNGPLVRIGTGRDVLFEGFVERVVGIAIDASGPAGGVSMAWRADPPLDGDVLPCMERPDPAPTAEVNLFGPGFQFLRADRITPTVTLPKSQNAIGAKRFLGVRGEYVGHFLLEHGDTLQVPPRLRHPDQPEAGSLIAQVNAWMQDFSPGVRLDLDAIAMTDTVRPTYAFKGTGPSYGQPLRATNVGFGLTHALPVLTACLAAAEGSLVVVENPEAQLHPRGQVAMGRLMALAAANGAQLVVESHSDHVLNGIRLAAKGGDVDPEGVKLHFFSREAGQATVFDTPVLGGDGRLSFWPEDFFDQWEKSLDMLLA